MTSRLMLLSIASVFAAATAHAQAPGQWTPEPGYAQPPPAAAVVAPAPALRKFSIGLNVGQTELTAKGFEDMPVTFGVGSLAVRYRAWRHLELELTFGGGRQTLDDEYADGRTEGDLAMATGTLAARYRFNPHNKWNWWLLAGVGGTTIARHDASDDEVEAAQRPHFAFGAGIERRFNRFALQFELRAMAVGQTEDEMELADQGVMVTEGLSGGNFSFGASYYF